MSDERRAEIEAVARALHEQGFGFDIDADPVARESMFSVARVVLDRVRDARGNDALRAALVETLRNDRSGLGTSADAERIAGLVLGVLAARSPQGEDHEAGIEAFREVLFKWQPPLRDILDDTALDEAIAAYLSVSAPKADEN